jgi:hypothetical protein
MLRLRRLLRHVVALLALSGNPGHRGNARAQHSAVELLPPVYRSGPLRSGGRPFLSTPTPPRPRPRGYRAPECWIRVNSIARHRLAQSRPSAPLSPERPCNARFCSCSRARRGRSPSPPRSARSGCW